MQLDRFCAIILSTKSPDAYCIAALPAPQRTTNAAPGELVAQYQLHFMERSRSRRLQRTGAGGVLLSNTEPPQTEMENPMEKEVSPVEARSGIISGRVLTVLAISFAGAAVALVIAWLAIGFH